MSDAPPPAAPEWVAKRDGQLVPFEADKISRSLFAAAEGLGRPDAFLARELAGSVVHFLTGELDGAIPTTSQVAEVIVKVVRELGHPALALAYASYRLDTARGEQPAARLPKAAPAPPAGETMVRITDNLPFADALRECARQYGLQAVFSRDLLALLRDGLITLPGLDRPAELAAVVLELHRGADKEEALFALLDGARRRGSRLVVLDSPEHLLAPPWPAPRPFAPAFARRLDWALRLAGMRAVVNLNAASAPAWADDTASGPLFDATRAQVAGLRDDQADHLAREWCGLPGAAVRIDWHLGPHDFAAGSPACERLLARLQEALRGGNVAFVFDRERRPVPLAEGLTRRRPALLLEVGLNLPRLAEWTGTRGDPERFLAKLVGLAGLALSAGSQKREFLRSQARVGAGTARAGAAGELTTGFLLDRAALLVVPMGLDHFVRTVTGHSMTHGAASLELGRRVLQGLREALRAHGGGRYPEACIDGPVACGTETFSHSPSQLPGLTPWDPGAALTNQVRAAGVLHGVVEAGTLALVLDEAAGPGPGELLEALRLAWEKTEIVRVRFVRAAATQTSLPFPAGRREEGL